MARGEGVEDVAQIRMCIEDEQMHLVVIAIMVVEVVCVRVLSCIKV